MDGERQGKDTLLLFSHSTERPVQLIRDKNYWRGRIIFLHHSLDFFCSLGQLKTDCVMAILCVVFEYIIGIRSSRMCIHGTEKNVLQTLQKIYILAKNTYPWKTQKAVNISTVYQEWKLKGGGETREILWPLLPLTTFLR